MIASNPTKLNHCRSGGRSNCLGICRHLSDFHRSGSIGGGFPLIHKAGVTPTKAFAFQGSALVGKTATTGPEREVFDLRHPILSLCVQRDLNSTRGFKAPFSSIPGRDGGFDVAYSACPIWSNNHQSRLVSGEGEPKSLAIKTSFQLPFMGKHESVRLFVCSEAIALKNKCQADRQRSLLIFGGNCAISDSF